MAKQTAPNTKSKTRPSIISSKKNKKDLDLLRDTEQGVDQFLTTDQGVKINDDQNSLKAGARGATLLEDLIRCFQIQPVKSQTSFKAYYSGKEQM